MATTKAKIEKRLFKIKIIELIIKSKGFEIYIEDNKNLVKKIILKKDGKKVFKYSLKLSYCSNKININDQILYLTKLLAFVMDEVNLRIKTFDDCAKEFNAIYNVKIDYLNSLKKQKYDYMELTGIQMAEWIYLDPNISISDGVYLRTWLLRF